MAKRADYVARYAAEVTVLLDTFARLKIARAEFGYLGYDKSVTDDDCKGIGFSAEQLAGAIQTLDSLDKAAQDQGAFAILYALKQ